MFICILWVCVSVCVCECVCVHWINSNTIKFVKLGPSLSHSLSSSLHISTAKIFCVCGLSVNTLFTDSSEDSCDNKVNSSVCICYSSLVPKGLYILTIVNVDNKFWYNKINYHCINWYFCIKSGMGWDALHLYNYVIWHLWDRNFNDFL